MREGNGRVNVFLSVQKTDYSGLIRRTLQNEGLAGAVQKLPLERKFKLETVREVWRTLPQNPTRP